MIALRPYQQKALGVLRQLHARHGRGIVVLPTGTGKTVLGLALVSEVLRNDGRCLWLAHRDELIEQPRARCQAMDIKDVGIVKADSDDHNRAFVLASVQTLARPERIARLDSTTFDLIVVDEAHHATSPSYLRILSSTASENTTILGLTATPFRHDGANLATLFTDGVVFSYQIIEAITDGYLVDITWRQIPCNFTLDHVAISNGDFSASELDDLLLHCDIPNIAVQAISTHAPSRRTVVYTPSVKTTEAVCNALLAEGFRAASITGKTDAKTRRSTLSAIRDGTIQIVVNCSVLTEGWDCPPLDCALIARPTRSDGLYRQMLGRVLRPWPTKNTSLVLDVTPRNLNNARDLVTAPILFGIEPKQPTIQNLSSNTTNQRTTASRVPRLRWTPSWITHNDAIAAPAGQLGLLIIAPTNNGLWITVLANRGKITHIAPPTDHDLALGLARDVLSRAKKLARNDSAWRSLPPTAAQLNALKAWHSTATPSTRGEASDALNLAILRATLPKIHNRHHT